MENDDADVGEDAARHNRSAAARMETDDASQHDRWMRRALDLADAAVRRGEVPVGAVFVDEALHRRVVPGRVVGGVGLHPCGTAALAACCSSAAVLRLCGGCTSTARP